MRTPPIPISLRLRIEASGQAQPVGPDREEARIRVVARWRALPREQGKWSVANRYLPRLGRSGRQNLQRASHRALRGPNEKRLPLTSRCLLRVKEGRVLVKKKNTGK